MRRKKPDPVPVEAAAPAPVVESAYTVLDDVRVCLYGVLLFLAMTVQTGRMSMVLLAAAFVLTLGRSPLQRMRGRFCLPVLGFLAFALMYGAAGIYSSMGEYAVKELAKFLASFSLAAILLLRFDRKHIPSLLWMAVCVCSVLSLICVDMGCSRALYGLFNEFMKLLGMDFDSTLVNSTGARLNGLYNDANITGAILGPAVLLAMHLVHTSKERWKRAVGCVLLGVCSVGFLTAMSRGAILCFGLAALVFLAAERTDRTGLFFVMLNTAVCMLVFGSLAMLTMQLGSAVPLVFCFLCGAALFLLDWGVCSRLTERLRGHGRSMAIACAALAVFACALTALALNWTVPYALSENTSFVRGLPLSSGDYTINGEWDSDVEILIYSRSREQALMGRGETVLYNGALDDAAFTVPETSLRVYFTFRSSGDVEVRKAALSDGTNIPLRYKLLPEMVVSRLQDGLFQGYSYLVRVQYDIDGWKLFQQSPLFGFGLGSTEGWLTSLQPFFYESLYLHNHILQVMCDMGLIGLVFWLTFLGGVLWLLIRRLREEKDPLAAALLACWLMMFVHGLMEIDFSIRSFQCFAWLLLLLPVLLYAKPLSEKAAKWGGAAAAVFVWGWILVFGVLMEGHRAAVRESADFSTSSVSEFMDAMKRFVRMDVFDREQFQLNFVANAVILDDSRYNREMRLYKEALETSGTYTACTGLAEFYYLPRGELDEMFACSQKAVVQEASTHDAWNQQFEFYRETVLPAVGADNVTAVVDGTLSLRDFLTEFSEGRIEEIQLTAENQAFLSWAEAVKEQGLTGEAALVLLTISSSGFLQS